MDYYEFKTKNAKALDEIRFASFSPKDIEQCNKTLKYRGFVNCVAAVDDASFVMFTNADDIVAGHYLYAGPATFERGTLNLWSHLVRQSKWIYDIGAFTGVFALSAVATNPNCRVMAFEPSFVTYSRLLVNIMANGFDGQIAPVRGGLGETFAELDLHHSSGVYVMASDESFSERNAVKPWFIEKVQVFSLDRLLAEQDRFRKELVLEIEFNGADLLKIDVENFETEVIHGMRETIARCHPSIIMEILDESNEVADVAFLTRRYMEMLELLGPGYEMKNIDETTGQLDGPNRGKNNLFIHKSKIHHLSEYNHKTM